MKKLSKSLNIVLVIILSIWVTSCQDDQLTEGSTLPNLSTRAVVTPTFDWENADYMPVPSGQSPIPSPWVGQGSIASTYGVDVVNDRKESEGWVLMYSSFTTISSGQLINPYFILYNKYRGVMRIFIYITTQFVAPSSYIQDGISIVSSQPTSMLNFLGQDLVDATKNQLKHVQMEPAATDGSLPLASNKWYMIQYELAYDPNIANIPYNNIQLNWYLNYYNVEKINLGGTATGKLTAIVGSSSNTDIFTPLIGVGKTIGTGAIGGIGQSYIEKHTTNTATGSNTMGMDNDDFKFLSKAVSSAVSAAQGNYVGVIMRLLSGIFGGSSSSTPVSFNLNANIELEGTGTSGGSFPSSPISFWVPGTDIKSNAVGYIPLYNKTLGIINFSGKPSITINATEVRTEYGDPRTGETAESSEITYHIPQTPINYSSYLQINPEVLKIAKVTIERQDLVLSYDFTPIGGKKTVQTLINPTQFYYSTDRYRNSNGISGAGYYGYSERFGVRFTIKVAPLDGSPSTIILKSFLLNNIGRTEIDQQYAPY